jgi:ATP-dependent helicase HrpA
MRPGVRRLLRASLPSPVRPVERGLGTSARLVLGTNPDGTLADLLADCADAAVDALVREPPWTRAAWLAVRDDIAAELVAATRRVTALVEGVLAAAHDVRLRLPAQPPPAQLPAIEDIRDQFRRLLPRGFVARTGQDQLRDLARYVTAIGRRLDRLPRDVEGDRGRMQRVHAVQGAYDELIRALPTARRQAEDVRDIARLLEELRVSLWAQQLGTARPVSEQRIYRAIDAIAP